MQIETMNELQAFLAGVAGAQENKNQGVFKRADHHAKHVYFTAQQLAGLVMWKADPGSIHVREREDGTPYGNVLWFEVQGRRYVLSYNHENILLKKESLKGPVIAEFNDTITREHIDDSFSKL